MIEGLVTKVKKEIKLKSFYDVIELHPFGDIHWDTDACERRRFDDDLRTMKKSKYPLYLGMGDYLDFVAWGDRKKICNAGTHDTTMEKLNRMCNDDLKSFARKIAFMKPNIIGLLDGNHDWVDDHGRGGAEVMSNWLSTAYLGWLTYIKLSINVFGQYVSVDIVACHGKGGGKLPGTSINQVEDLHRIFPAADIFIQGHNHQRGGWPISSLFASSYAAKEGQDFAIKEKTQWLCRSGSYMKAYETGCGGFASRKLLRPSSLGKITIRISVERHEHNNLKAIAPKIMVEA